MSQRGNFNEKHNNEKQFQKQYIDLNENENAAN